MVAITAQQVTKTPFNELCSHILDFSRIESCQRTQVYLKQDPPVDQVFYPFMVIMKIQVTFRVCQDGPVSPRSGRKDEPIEVKRLTDEIGLEQQESIAARKSV